MPRIDHKLFYSKTVAKYGRCAQGVAWSDESRQKRRFAQLLRAIPDISKAAVVDAGCGFGDLWLFMRERGTLPKGYLGLDMLDLMVEEAKARTGQKILKCDILKDPLPEADWYLASGSLNLLTRFETLLAIRRMVHASRAGVVFNLLKGVDKSKTYNYWMPQEINKACLTFGRVKIYEGYIEGDFTVCIDRRF